MDDGYPLVYSISFDFHTYNRSLRVLLLCIVHNGHVCMRYPASHPFIRGTFQDEVSRTPSKGEHQPDENEKEKKVRINNTYQYEHVIIFFLMYS